MSFAQESRCRCIYNELSIDRREIASLTAAGMLVVVVPIQAISI
jgi:hypothetical protein